MWDDQRFLSQYALATEKKDWPTCNGLLSGVAATNWQLVQFYPRDVSRTNLVSRRTAHEAQERIEGHGQVPLYTFSGMGTGDALFHFAGELAPTGRVVCALNFANGRHVGGGYLNGAMAQEE